MFSNNLLYFEVYNNFEVSIFKVKNLIEGDKFSQNFILFEFVELVCNLQLVLILLRYIVFYLKKKN